MTQKEKVLDKIRKILAKANDRATTAAEAQAFAAKAAEMLAEHKLTMTEVEFSEMQREDPIREWYVDPAELGLKSKRARVGWEERLMTVVAREHMCAIFVHFGANSYTLIGREQDAQVAIYMYHYLHRTCTTTLRKTYGAEFRRATKEGTLHELRGFQESYRVGFVSAVAERYRVMREERERAARGTGVALVRISNELDAARQRADEISAERAYKTTKMPKLRSTANDEGYRRGRKTGEKVSLTANVVGEGSTRKELGS